MDFKDKQELKSAERRNFLKLAGTGGFTAAMVAGAGGVSRNFVVLGMRRFSGATDAGPL